MQVYSSRVIGSVHQASLKLGKLKRSKFLNPVNIEEIKSILERTLRFSKDPNLELPCPKLKSVLTPSSKPTAKPSQTKCSFNLVGTRVNPQKKKKPLLNFKSLKSTSLHPVLHISRSPLQPRHSFLNRPKELCNTEAKIRRDQLLTTDSLSSSSSDLEIFRTMYH